MALVDSALLNQYRSILDRSAAANRELAGAGLGLGEKIGKALMGRAGDVRRLNVEKDATSQKLLEQEQRAIGELTAIGQTQGAGPYEQAQMDARAQQLRNELADIGTAQSRIDDIGSTRFRDVYKDRAMMPGAVERRGGELLSGRAKDIAEGIARKRAEAKEQARLRERLEDQAHDLNVADIENTRKRQAEERKAAIAAEKKTGGGKLSAGEKGDIADGLSAIATLKELRKFVAANKGSFGRLAGQASKAGGYASGKGAAKDFINKQLLSVQLAGGFLEGGKLTDPDAARYQAMIGSQIDDPNQVLSNIDSIISQVQNKVDTIRSVSQGGGAPQAKIEPIVYPALSTDSQVGETYTYNGKTVIVKSADESGFDLEVIE